MAQVDKFTSFADSFLRSGRQANQFLLQQRKVELLEEIQRGTLGIREKEQALAELKNLQGQENRGAISKEFANLSGLLGDGGEQQVPAPQQDLQQVLTDQFDPRSVDPVGVSGRASGQTGAESLRFGTPPPDLQPAITPRSKQSQEQVIRSLGRLQTLDPTGKSAELGLKLLEVRDAKRLANDKQVMERNFKESSNLLKIKDPEMQGRAIVQTIRDRAKEGLSSPALQKILELPLERRVVGLEQRKTINTDFKLLIENQEKELERQSKEGIEAAKLAAAPEGGIIPSSQISPEGFIVKENPDGTFTTTRVLEQAEVGGEGGKASAVTKIFDDGTTIQAMPNGDVLVKNPVGNNVTGDARLTVLKNANQNIIDLARTKAGAKAAGTRAIARSEKQFDEVKKIKVSIDNIDNAIAAIDAGAKTGALTSFFPSIRAASVRLDNIQKAMGLDVIGTTTFGALSKGELDLALSKALPTRLSPPELRKWLIDKKAAQVKLANYLQNAAIYLGTPGNTSAGWAESQRFLQSQQAKDAENESNLNQGTPSPTGGGQIMRFDAQGNRL